MKRKNQNQILNSSRQVFNFLELKHFEKFTYEYTPKFRKIKIINESIKFFVFHFFIAFILFSMTYNNQTLRDFYNYSFGLFFGLLIYPALICAYVFYLFYFLSLFMRKMSFSYFSRIKKVDIKIIKQQISFLLISFFLAFALFSHIILHYIYNNSFDFSLESKNLQSIFTNGWYARFYFDGPNITNNIGFFFDTIFNILYYVSLSGIFPILFLISFVVFIICKLKVIKYNEWKKKYSRKKTVVNIYESFKKYSKIFYQTPNVVLYYTFVIQCAKELNYNYKKNNYKKLMSYLYKNFRNLDINFMKQYCIGLVNKWIETITKETTNFASNFADKTNKTDQEKNIEKNKQNTETKEKFWEIL